VGADAAADAGSATGLAVTNGGVLSISASGAGTVAHPAASNSNATAAATALRRDPLVIDLGTSIAALAADALAGPALTFAEMQDLKPLSAWQMPANLGFALLRYRVLRKGMKPSG
jgi:hypothetical protein